MKKTICLNMIVKNENAVIERCLNSIKKIIDTWVIVDTGSTDNTPAMITNCLQDIPGKLYQRPWKNFEDNRNEALRLARNTADYVLFIDADEQFQFSDSFIMPPLEKDAYYIPCLLPGNIQFFRMLLVNNHLQWNWEGVLHEALYSPVPGRSCAVLSNVTNIATEIDGHRNSDPDKYLKDAQILEGALQKHPENSRYVFFLAQSYFQAKNYLSALKNYQKRTRMSGFDEEIYFSHYMSAVIQEILELPSELFLANYQTAKMIKPSRAEPIFRMACHFYKNKAYAQACELLQQAIQLPLPSDGINIERNIYEFGLQDLLIECTEALGSVKQ